MVCGFGNGSKWVVRSYDKMRHRIWKPLAAPAAPQAPASTITFYDAGPYWGQLVNNSGWMCFRVVNRKRVGEEIHEDLELVENDDFVPWHIASTETYPLEDFEKGTGNILIPGWQVVFS